MNKLVRNHVRVGTIEDLPIVLDLCARFMKLHPVLPYEPDVFEEWYREIWDDKHYCVRILNEDDGMIIGGSTGVNFTSKMMGVEIVWYTRETARGRGISLYRSFEAWAKEQKLDMIKCSIRTESPAMKRLGFQVTNVTHVKQL